MGEGTPASGEGPRWPLSWPLPSSLIPSFSLFLSSSQLRLNSRRRASWAGWPCTWACVHCAACMCVRGCVHACAFGQTGMCVLRPHVCVRAAGGRGD